MATVVSCPACQRSLRVTDELVGTQVRCPSCREVFTGAVPPQNGAAPEPPSSSPLGVTTVPNDTPPPVPKIDPDKVPCPSCQTPNSRMLAVCHVCGFNLEAAAAAADEDAERPWESRRDPQNVRRDCEPHRGTLILVLGIISLVFTGFLGLPFGLAAWIMGQRDVKKIRLGEMDPSGEATTKAGQVCGIVGTVLGSICTLATGAYIVFWIALMLLMPFGGPRTAPMPPPGPPPGVTKPAVPAQPQPGPNAPLEGEVK